MLETLDKAIAQWNVQWFPQACAEVAGIRAATTDARPESDGTGWRVYRASVGVRTHRTALSRLVNQSLDLRVEAADLTEGDRYLLDVLGGKILESLVETVELALAIAGLIRAEPYRPADPLSDGGGLLVTLADLSGRETLTLAVPREAIFRHLRTSLPRATGAAVALQPLVEALASVHIPVEAQIGEAELTLAELNELVVGDVLVLDRRVGQAVDIAGARSRDVFAKATLTNVEDGFALVF